MKPNPEAEEPRGTTPEVPESANYVNKTSNIHVLRKLSIRNVSRHLLC
jgi:hypothetical protein